MEKKPSAIQVVTERIESAETLINSVRKQLDMETSQRYQGLAEEGTSRRKLAKTVAEDLITLRAAQRRLQSGVITLMITGIVQAGMILILTFK